MNAPLCFRRLTLGAVALVLASGAVVACTASSETAPTPDSAATWKSLMLEAIDSGDADGVTALLAQGVSPDESLGTGGTVITPLHRAAARDQTDIIALLVGSGADVDIQVNGVTPLMMAAESGSPDSVLALLEGGADPLIGNLHNWGMTPIHYTSRKCNTATLDTLVEWGIDIDLLDVTKSTVGHWSVFYNCPDNIRYLIDHGANVNLLDENDSTLLRWARDLGFEELATMIEAAGGHE